LKLEEWTNRNQEFREPIGNDEGCKERSLIDIIPIYVTYFSYMFSPLWHGNGNDDNSSEEYFENSKISRGSYLYLELFIFDHLFELYLLTQVFL
jgi:hypothetical protein